MLQIALLNNVKKKKKNRIQQLRHLVEYIADIIKSILMPLYMNKFLNKKEFISFKIQTTLQKEFRDCIKYFLIIYDMSKRSSLMRIENICNLKTIKD